MLSRFDKYTIVTVLTAAILGALIWILSPLLTGAVMPADEHPNYYTLSLLFVGVVIGILFPKRLKAVFGGVVLGQLIYALIFLPLGSTAGAGIIYVSLYGVLSVAGAIIGSWIRRAIRGESDESA